MELQDCLRAVRRRWWLVAIALTGALAVAGLVTWLAVPQYASTVSFFVTTPNRGVTDAYQGGLFSQQRVKSYVDLLTGDRLARSVATERDIGLNPAQVRSRVRARAIPDTVLLEATVIDSSRHRSQLVAQALGKHFVNLVETLETPPDSSTPTVKVAVVAGPTLNPSPVSPRPVRNLSLAALLGLLVGVGAAILRELRDTTVSTSADLQTQATAPVLAVVPYEGTARKNPLIVSHGAHSARAEAFRRLRTNLQFVDVDHPVKVVVITSSVPEEGKSTTAVNLAIAFAEAERRVLLVEADLRRPKVADYLSLEAAVGLSNVLAGQVRIEDALQRWGRLDLWVLPSGFIPPNPSELLSSRNMATLVERERENYDLIIIDTPPLLPVIDAAVVAARVDGAVLVTRSASTSRDQVRAAAATLRGVDARVLGAVLNMQASREDAPYYHYYQYRSPGRFGDAGSRTRSRQLAPRSGGQPGSLAGEPTSTVPAHAEGPAGVGGAPVGADVPASADVPVRS